MELETPEELEDWALEQFSKDLTGDGESQEILLTWFAGLREQVDPNTARYGRLISDAVSVLENLRSAFSTGELHDANSRHAARFALWAWPSETTLQVRPTDWIGESPTSVDDLDTALAEYLKRPWLQHDLIDASAINALLFSEVSAFLEQVKSGAALGRPNWSYIFSGGNVFKQMGLALAGKTIAFLLAWVLLPAVAIILFVYGYQTNSIIVIGLWGIYVFYRLLMVPFRWRARRARQQVAEKANEISQSMLKAWSASRGRAINPTRLKERVLAAEESGAIFPAVLHTIIDRAIERDPTALMR